MDKKLAQTSSSFASNVLKLVTGSVFAQGLGILVIPIVARLFAPEAFGVAALFASITGIIGVLVCLRYEVSIMLPKTDEEAANLLGVSLCSVLIITAISGPDHTFCQRTNCSPLEGPRACKISLAGSHNGIDQRDIFGIELLELSY